MMTHNKSIFGSGALNIRSLRISAAICLAAVSFASSLPAYADAPASQPAALSAEALHALVDPLDASMNRIQGLIDKAAAAGAETHYFKASLAVLRRYRGEVFDMTLPKEPQVKEETARFLVACASRTEQGLEDAIAHPAQAIRVPNVDLTHLDVREGSFFAGDRPAMLLGYGGWVSIPNLDFLSALGCTVCAAEQGPSSIFPSETVSHESESLTPLLQAAQQHNIKVDLLLSPHYMPGWAYAKWPDIDPGNRRNIDPFMPWDVRSARLRTFLDSFLNVIIPQAAKNPALLDYDLINEAWYAPFGNVDPATLNEFAKNHPNAKKGELPEDYTAEQVTDFVKWFTAAIHKRDTAHPIYVKVLTSQDILCVDREAIGDVLTANGMDSYPTYPDHSGELAADFAWTLLRLDFHRSLTPDKPILDGEYHPSEGVHAMPDAYFRTAFWAPALHGKDSAAVWAFSRVDEASYDWHANAVEVLGHTSLDFVRLSPEIHAFQRQHPAVAVYYGPFHPNYTHPSDPGDGLREAYQASLFQDADLGIMTEKRAEAGALSAYKVLVLPNNCDLPPDVKAKIDEFKTAGGTVIQCPPNQKSPQIWPMIHDALAKANLQKLVSADQWGVECRSVTLGDRHLFYLINYNREPVDVQLKSAWPLGDLLELRTQTHLSGDKVHLDPLEFKLMQATAAK